MKGCAWTALILIVVGFILAFTASTVKGAEAIRQVVDNVTGGKVQVDLTGLDRWGIFITEGAEELTDGVREGLDNLEVLEELEDNVNYDIDASMIFADGFEILTGDISKNFSGEGILELDIEVGGCKFSMEESADGDFHVEAENTRKFQGYVSGNTLFIKGTMKTGSDSEIVLQVPAGFSFERINMELGAGAMELGDMRAKELDLEVGAGQITADSLTVDSLLVAVGMGEIVIEDMQVNKLDAQVGMGNFRAEGAVNEKVIVECAMGNIDMKLAGSEKDYDYSIECGMGNVQIGGNTYSGLGNEKDIDNDADRKMDVECAVGNIEIRFAD